jgi:fused signal recognition particle receptor
MFKALRDKLKGALKKISKKVEDEAPEEIQEVVTEKKIVETPQKKIKKKPVKKKPKKEIPQKEEKVKEKSVEESPEKKKGFFSKIFKKKEEREEPKEEVPVVSKEEPSEEIPEGPIEEKKEEPAEEIPEKRGLFKKFTEKIVTKKISASQFDTLFSDLEMVLLENNVALSVIDTLKDDLKSSVVDVPLKRGKILDIITSELKDSVEHLFAVDGIDLVGDIKKKKEKPFVIAFVGVNGSGKTTTIAKVAHMLKEKKLSCLMAAGDTWRAASIQQLEEHGKNLGVRVVKHDYGSDPAAVAFDGIKAARANNIDVVLIDTAGRQHSNKNLMEEMKKIVRVSKPDLKIFVGEALVGNDAVDQAQQFNNAVSVDGIILTKADVDEKGGAMISVSHVTRKPILYLGVGQDYNDLVPFTSETVLRGIGLY